MSVLWDDVQSLTLRQHPDALFDSPYEDVPLDIRPYAPLGGGFAPAASDARGLTLRNPAGAVLRVEACTPEILRFRLQPSGELRPSTTEALGLIRSEWPGAPFKTAQERGGCVFETAALRLALDGATNDLRVDDARGQTLLQTLGGGLRFSPEPPAFGGQRFLGLFTLADEHVFGFGGRIMPPDRTGTTADMFAMKVGRLSGDYGGFPIPLFLSTRGYAVFLNNPWPHVYFDMGRTRPGQWFVHAPGGECDFFVIHGPQFRDLVRRFTEIVGRIPVPQRWWLGFWCSSLSFSSAAEVLEIARRLRREDYPADALVLDGPWRGGPEFLKKYMQEGEYPTNDLNWHPDFGDGPGMVRQLEGLGFKTVLHQNSRSYRADTIEAGLASGALRREGHEVVVRLTYPEGEAFYRRQLEPRHKEGVALWWLDHGDRVSGAIRPGVPSRNLFGALWGRATQQAAVADGRPEPLVLIRGAGIGGQRCALPWPGDTRFGVDYFAEDIWFCLNAGLSGFPITSADLGGFMAPGPQAPPHNRAFDEDNIARRLCQGLFFLPTPRMHADDSHPPKLPWNCPLSTRRLYREMLSLRYQFTPYFYSCALAAHRTGEPLLRPLVYHHQDDPRVYALGDQFYIGEWLLAAPVTAKGQASRQVYLPEGRWVCYWTGRRHEGPATLTVETPLYEPRGLPLFVKAGALLPLQPPVSCLTDEPPPLLTLDVYPCGASRFELHEAPGVTNAFECFEESGRLRLILPNATAKERVYVVRLRLPATPRAATLDGARLPELQRCWDAAAGIFTCQVTVRAGSTAVLAVEHGG